MRYHFFPNHFEKKVKIEKKRSPLYDRTLATVADYMYYPSIVFPRVMPHYVIKKRFLKTVFLKEIIPQNCIHQRD